MALIENIKGLALLVYNFDSYLYLSQSMFFKTPYFQNDHVICIRYCVVSVIIKAAVRMWRTLFHSRGDIPSQMSLLYNHIFYTYVNCLI